MADRSVAIRIAVKDVQEAKRRLASLGEDGKAALAEMERGGPRASRALNNVEREVRGLSRATHGLRNDFRTLGAGLATFGIGFTLASQIRDLTEAAVSIERIENTLAAASGTFATVGRDFGFIREQAVRLGLDLETAAAGYARLSASALRAGADTEDVRLIFQAFSEASRVLGLDAEAFDGVIRAIDQSFTKFTVSAEELRQQLGDRLPGAFTYAAQAMGVTGQELDRLIRTNQVLATELFPEMARVIQRTFGPAVERSADSLQATLGRLQTAMYEARVEFARSGFIDEFAAGLERVTDALGDPEIRANLREIGSFLGDSVGFVVENAQTLIAVSTALTAMFVAGKAAGLVGEAVGGRRGGAIGKIGGGLVGAIGAGVATSLGLNEEDAETLRADLAGAVAALTDDAESATRRVQDARINLAEIRAETAQVENEVAAAMANAREAAPATLQRPAATLLAGLEELQLTLEQASARIDATGAEGLQRAEAALRDLGAARDQLARMEAERARLMGDIGEREAQVAPLQAFREMQRAALPGLELPPLDRGLDEARERLAALEGEIATQREAVALAGQLAALDELRADVAQQRIALVSEETTLTNALAEAESDALKELTAIARNYAAERERLGERRAEAVADLRQQVADAERLAGLAGTEADEQRRLQASIEGAAKARDLDLGLASRQAQEIVALTVRLSDLEAQAAASGEAFAALADAVAGLRGAQADFAAAGLPTGLAEQAAGLSEALTEARDRLAELGPAAREAFAEAVRAEAIELGVDLDTAEARAQIDAFLADEAGRRFLIGVDADVSEAERAFATLLATIERTRAEAEEIGAAVGLASDIGRELASARADAAGFNAALAAGAQGFDDLRTAAGRAFDLERRVRDFREQLEELSAVGVERVVADLRAAGVELEGLGEAGDLDSLAGALARSSQEAAILRDGMRGVAEESETIADVMVETLGGAFDRIVERGADTFEDMFAGAGFQVDDFARGMVETLRRAFAEIAAFAIIRPVLEPVAGQLLGGGAAGGAGPGAGVLTQSIGGLRGAIDRLGNTLGFGGGPAANAEFGLMPNWLSGDIARAQNPLTMSRLLGTTAFGGLTAAAFAPMFGLNSTGAGIGGAAGTAGGLLAASSTALAPLLGPLAPFAPLLGGAAGGLLGGVVGDLFKDKPSDKAQGEFIDLARDITTSFGQDGKKFSEENRRAADGISTAIGRFADSLQQLTNGDLAGRFNIVVGSRDGFRLERFAEGQVPDRDRPERIRAENPEELIALAVREVLSGLQNAPEVQRRLGRISTESPEAALADVQLIQTFSELTGRTTALDSSLADLDARFEPLIEAAERLALPVGRLTAAYDEQREVLIRSANAQIDALAGGEGAQLAIQYGDRLRELNRVFSEGIRNADELGRQESELWWLRSQAFKRAAADLLASLPQPANNNAPFSVEATQDQARAIREQYAAAIQVVRANEELGISEQRLARMRREALAANREAAREQRRAIIAGVMDQARALADTDTDFASRLAREVGAVRDQFDGWRETLRAYGRDVSGLNRLQREAVEATRDRLREERRAIRRDIRDQAIAAAEGGDLPFGRETQRQIAQVRSQFDDWRDSLRAYGVELEFLNRKERQAVQAIRERRLVEAQAEVAGIEGQLRGEGERIRGIVDQLAGGISDALRELTTGSGSALSSGARLNELQAEFSAVSAQALAGQVDAIERLPALALELDRLRTEFGGRAVQASGQDEIARVLEQVEAMVRAQGRRAEADLPAEFRAGTRFLGDVFRGEGEMTRDVIRDMTRELRELRREVGKLKGRSAA